MLGQMARIRIVDAWLRCPTAHPTHQRAVMVVAESWGEQRVLMRAYADSPDQTRPTIALHGAELAIGPAGTDPHGPWGIHVEPPADGRAQKLRDELELAARRLSGSKGSPPRLMDEESPFDRKRTNHWAPGTPPDVPAGGAAPYYEPSEPAAPGAPPPAPAGWPGAPAPAPAPGPARNAQPWPAGAWHVPVPAASPSAPTVHMPATSAPAADPHPPATAAGTAGPATTAAGTAGPATTAAGTAGPATTAFGFTHGAGAQLGAGARIGSPSGPDPEHATRRRLISVVRRTMPIGFQLTGAEMAVLDALDAAPWLNEARVAEIAGVEDGGAWMRQLIEKLGQHGLDLIETLSGAGGELAYALRR
jgi:hypothetical protein